MTDTPERVVPEYSDLEIDEQFIPLAGVLIVWGIDEEGHECWYYKNMGGSVPVSKRVYTYELMKFDILADIREGTG